MTELYCLFAVPSVDAHMHTHMHAYTHTHLHTHILTGLFNRAKQRDITGRMGINLSLISIYIFDCGAHWNEVLTEITMRFIFQMSNIHILKLTWILGLAMLNLAITRSNIIFYIWKYDETINFCHLGKFTSRIYVSSSVFLRSSIFTSNRSNVTCTEQLILCWPSGIY